MSDKSRIVEFARGLSALGTEILSTGGTAALLAREGVKVTQVQELTGAPEMLGGRVKTRRGDRELPGDLYPMGTNHCCSMGQRCENGLRWAGGVLVRALHSSGA